MSSEHDSLDIAKEVFDVLASKGEVNTAVVLAAMSMVLATISVEACMEEEKAVYAFRRSYGHAQRRLKQFLKGLH